MTKPEQEDTNNCNVQKILCEGLLEARLKGKVTCGLYETAEVLERIPSLRGICILPKETECQEDGCLLFMMETFCRENNIPLVKVGNMIKLAENVGLKYSENANWEELNCILIKTGISGLRRSSVVYRRIDALENICIDFAKHDKQVVVDN